ncbi:MAG: tetratricopeptide repeat protein [Candidatus Melainabacteria bacterium]|nr:tetratricopeptide repeat protein [Candidatus Melainabacteria bacterium]
MSTQITRPWLRPFMAGLCFVAVISGSISTGTFFKSQFASYALHEHERKWQDEMDQGIEAFRETAYPLADAHFREALKVCAIDGENYRNSARWLGVTLYHEEKDLEAVQKLQKSLYLTRKSFKNASYETADLTLWYARALERVGSYPQAERLYLETLSIYTEITDPLSPNYINASVDYANFLCVQNRPQEALPFAQEAYLVDMQDYGLHNSSTLQAGKCLAKIYNRLGRLGDAEPLLNQNLELSRQIYGEKTQQTAHCYLELANHCRATKDFDRADLLYKGIVDMLKVTIGPSQTLLIETELNYARSLELQGQYKKAKELIKQCQTQALERYGKRHPLTLGLISEFGRES